MTGLLTNSTPIFELIRSLSPNALGQARLAADSGLRGVVASPREIRAIRESCGDALTIVYLPLNERQILVPEPK